MEPTAEKTLYKTEFRLRTEYDFPGSVLPPALTHRFCGRLRVYRRSLMTEPGILAFGKLASADKYLFFVVTFTVTDSESRRL